MASSTVSWTASTANSAAHPFVRLMAYGRRYRSKAWLAGACSVLNTVFDLAPPALIGIAIDIVVDQQDSILARWGIVELRSQFILQPEDAQILNGLLGAEALLLGIFALLLWLKK